MSRSRVIAHFVENVVEYVLLENSPVFQIVTEKIFRTNFLLEVLEFNSMQIAFGKNILKEFHTCHFIRMEAIFVAP